MVLINNKGFSRLKLSFSRLTKEFFKTHDRVVRKYIKFPNESNVIKIYLKLINELNYLLHKNDDYAIYLYEKWEMKS